MSLLGTVRQPGRQRGPKVLGTNDDRRRKRRVGRFVGYKPAWKKAIVRLAEGQTIEFFEGV